jgi:two-component system CheB/CheR fusion protein
MPYRTQENRIDGVVITFADITVSKNLEAALRKAQSDLEKRFTHQTVELGRSQKNLQTEIKQRPRAKLAGGRTPGSGDKPKKPR